MLFLKKTLSLLLFILLAEVTHAQLFLPNFNEPIKIESISTEAEEIAPTPYGTGEKLYFVRADIKGGSKARKYGQEIWETTKVNGKWQEPTSIFKEANDVGNNGVIGSTEDGNKIYVFNSIQSRRKLARGIAFTNKEEDNEWSQLKKVEIEGFEIGDGYYSFHVNSSEDVILISKPANDTTENEDLFISTKKDGQWQEIINLGPTINTNGFEISPFLTEDKRTLYFASNGHGGIGSSDIFVSQRLDESWTNWTTPLNLGAPINSTGFDAYFIIGNNKEVFFTSNRDGQFSDIYTTNISENNSIKKANEFVIQNQFLYNGLPAKNVRFKAYDANKNLVKEISTDESGSFYFRNLQDDLRYSFVMNENDFSQFPGGTIYEVSGNQYKLKKYILTSDRTYTDLEGIKTNQNIVGEFQFKSLPLNNTSLLVYNSSNEIVDTIFTDDQGKFSYAKLNPDENYTFRPLDLGESDDLIIKLDEENQNGDVISGKLEFKKLPLNNTPLIVFDMNGEVVDTIFTDEYGNFSYKKLNANETYTFKPIINSDNDELALNLNEFKAEEIKGTFNYNELPLKNTPLVIVDENGITLDTIYTDENGEFKYSKLQLEKYSIKPLNSEDYDLAEINIVEEKKMNNTMVYQNKPVSNTPIVIYQDGIIVDTAYTNENGEFNYYQTANQNYKVEPLSTNDFDLNEIKLLESNQQVSSLKGIEDNVKKPSKIIHTTKTNFPLALYFDFNSAELTKESVNKLNKGLNQLKDGTFTRLVIEGHTDNIGTAANNLKVAAWRVNSVKEFITTSELNIKILEKVIGEDQPIESNKTASGRAKNRRVMVYPEAKD